MFRSISNGEKKNKEGRTRTGVLMTLQVKLCEEPCGADDDERRSGGVYPEVRRELIECGPGEVVRHDEGVRVDKLRVLLQDILNVLNPTHRPTDQPTSRPTNRINTNTGWESEKRRTLTSAAASTLSLSSLSHRDVSTALGRPTLSAARKKLFPTSAAVTSLRSSTVKWPIPGRTRFLSVAVAVAVAPITSSRADSSAAWPVAAHSLSDDDESCSVNGSVEQDVGPLCARGDRAG